MTSSELVAALYRNYSGRLRGLMEHRFGIPESEVEGLLHDVFASLLKSTTPVHDAEKWLIGAACNRSRLYWRDTAGHQLIPLGDDVSARPQIEDGLVLDQILDQLPDRAGEVLRLRYLVGLSGREIARHYGMSVEYAYVLIHRSLEQARALAQGRKG